MLNKIASKMAAACPFAFLCLYQSLPKNKYKFCPCLSHPIFGHYNNYIICHHPYSVCIIYTIINLLDKLRYGFCFIPRQIWTHVCLLRFIGLQNGCPLSIPTCGHNNNELIQRGYRGSRPPPPQKLQVNTLEKGCL